MFEIEKNVPLPPKTNVGRPKPELVLAMEALEVGDAVNCGSAHVKNVTGAVGWTSQRLGRKFATRTVDGVLRIYRTA